MSTFITYVQNIGLYLYNRKRINQIAIGYVIKPTLHVNNILREQVELFLIATLNQNTMEVIKGARRKKDICIIALIMFYMTKTNNPIKVYRVLSCVLYSFIENNLELTIYVVIQKN